MKRLLCLSLGLLALSGCADEPAPQTTTQNAPLTPVALTSYQPLERVGCERIFTQTTNPIALYFEAIDASSVRVDLAREAIGTLHRHLFCMNTRDFMTNYNNIIDQLEKQAELRQYDTKLAPLVMILAESGGRYVDTRSQRLLSRFAPKLLQERVNNQVVAGGIGMFYRRGVSAVALSDAQLNLLVSSMETYSFMRSTCGVHQAIFHQFEDGTVKHAYVCLNDPCPIFDDKIDKIDLSSAQNYKRYCQTQRGRLDHRKRTGNTTTNGNASAGTPQYDDARSGLAQCVSQYTHAGRYGCFVESAAGDQGITTHTDAIKTRFDVVLNPKTCTSPAGYGDAIGEARDAFKQNLKARLERLQKHIEQRAEELYSIDAQLKQLQQACDDVGFSDEVCLLAKVDLLVELNAIKDQPGATADTRALLKKLLDLIESSNQLTEAIVKTLFDETNKDQTHLKEREKQLEQKEAHDDKTNGMDVQLCDASFGSCSNNCDIQSQVDLFENTSRCMGMATGDVAFASNEPTPDPTIMYPSPDQAHASDAFIGLANCVAGMTGAAPINAPQPGGLHCGSQVLCTDASTSISDDAGVCSCKVQASLPDKFKAVGWDIVSKCNQTIMCTGESSTCSCNGLIDSNNPKKVGGVPTDPTVFLMVNYEHP